MFQEVWNTCRFDLLLNIVISYPKFYFLRYKREGGKTTWSSVIHEQHEAEILQGPEVLKSEL